VPIGEVIARQREIPREQRVVCVCRVGARSAQVTAYLVEQGYDAVNMDGGMAAWEADGRPMVSETGQPATVL
jgi:rhodanese-related sulfurtransferase